MLRIKGTDGDAGTTQPWRFFSLEGRGEIGWESVAGRERRNGADWRAQSPIPFFYNFFDAFGDALYL